MVPEEKWVDLLHIAKEIRRSVRPVEPSDGFRRHLRSDLAVALGADRRYPPVAVMPRANGFPFIVVGACLGLAAVALALISWRNNRLGPRPQGR